MSPTELPIAGPTHSTHYGVVRGHAYVRRAIAALWVALWPAQVVGQGLSGRYELTATLAGQSFPARLELQSLEGRPWGRLTVSTDTELVAAVRGIEGVGDTWSFAVGGPLRSMTLTFEETVTGSMELGGLPPISLSGARSGDPTAPEELRRHHVLDPLGLADRAGVEGTSYPTTTPEGHMIFALHGPDLTRQTLATAARTADGLSDVRVLPLSGQHSDRSPAVTPDGSALVFASDRPVAGDSVDGYRLWIATRADGGGWSDPRPVDFVEGWPHDARQPSLTAEWRLYFASDAEGGHGESDIYVAERLGDRLWSVPRNVGTPVSGPMDEVGAFVAPDETYMVMSRAGGSEGPGGEDLFVSRRTTTDGWSAPIPLTLPVNTFANEYGAWISPTEGALYFTSDRYGFARIFRVDARSAGLPSTERE